eukprot:12128615-Alexandrium_andersonii.AAC.1
MHPGTPASNGSGLPAVARSAAPRSARGAGLAGPRRGRAIGACAPPYWVHVRVRDTGCAPRH